MRKQTTIVVIGSLRVKAVFTLNIGTPYSLPCLSYTFEQPPLRYMFISVQNEASNLGQHLFAQDCLSRIMMRIEYVKVIQTEWF